MANEKRLIDANALKDRFKLRIDWLEKDKHDEYTTGIWDGCLYDAKLIDEQPTVAAVEVVRCKDCKKRYTQDCLMQYTHYSDDFDANPEGVNLEWTDDNGFCSYGERKDNV